MTVRAVNMTFSVVTAFAAATWIAAAQAQSVQTISPASVQPQPEVVIAPNAPPPPRVETIPPPPNAESQLMYWRPGRWAWNGGSWEWSSGQYVERPAPQAVWEPGHWVQQPSGGYVWTDGRWQG